MKQVNVLNHPLLMHKLGYLRDKTTKPSEFKRLIGEVSAILAYEATSDIATEARDIETPLAATSVEKISNSPVIVSIMRAGNGMAEAISQVLPFASLGHIGIYRDPLLKSTVEYYYKVPEGISGKTVILTDPIIGTGGTSVASVNRLKQSKVGEVRFLNILASKVGLENLVSEHPDVKVYTLQIEQEFNEQGYLIPGIGDVVSRFYNTNG